MLPIRSIVSLRKIHVTLCFALMGFVTWGLLTTDPLAAVRNTRFGFIQTINDILIHCTVYTVFSASCMSLLRRRTDAWVRHVVLGLLIVHGVGTELLQTMVPRRMGDPLDAVANITGIAAGAMIAAWITNRGSDRAVKRSAIAG
ncbi:MAG: VanZ family protein [Rubripirellula sp.]